MNYEFNETTVKTNYWLESPAECFLGPEIKDWFEVPLYDILEPNETGKISLQIPHAGVPLGFVGLPSGIKVIKIFAGEVQIFPGYDPRGLGDFSKLRGIALRAGEFISVKLRNETNKKQHLKKLLLLCSKPPTLIIPENGKRGDKNFWVPDEDHEQYALHRDIIRDLSWRFNVERKDPEHTHIDCIHSPLKKFVPYPYAYNRPVHSYSSECSHCKQDTLFVGFEDIAAPSDQWCAPLGIVIDEEVAEHYMVTRLIMGEMPVFEFRRPVHATQFIAGLGTSPAIPFLCVPPRQSIRLEGIKCHHRKAPPFEVRFPMAIGDRMVA